jgi:hypothetical protein
VGCPPTAHRTAFVNSAPKRLRLTIQVQCPSSVPRCTNISRKSEHWPFGNWPGKDPVETKSENERERLRELAARIVIEQDHDKFTALIKELNQLLDEGQQVRHKTTDA